MKWLFPSTPLKINLWRIAILLALLGAWQGLSGPVFDKFWLSRPTDIAASFMAAAKNGTLLSDILITFHSTALGFLYGLIAGLVLGLVLAQSEAIALVFKPFILAIYGIPRIALAPVFILWFGIGLFSKVMMAALATFLLVFFNTYEGVRSADIELRNVSRVLGASGWRLFWYVTLPNASPWIIAGIRIAIPQALVAATVAEFIASFAGLGYRIMETTNTLDTAGTMRGILILMVVVMLLNFVLDALERRILRWRPKENESSSV
jgi:NitT/TauT family transport system permease protein